MATKTYHSVHRQYATVYNKEIPEKRVRVQFANNTFVAKNDELIKLMDDDIKKSRELGGKPSFLSLDEKELIEAQEPKFVVIDGKKVDIKTLKQAEKEKEELKKQNELLQKENEELKSTKGKK